MGQLSFIGLPDQIIILFNQRSHFHCYFIAKGVSAFPLETPYFQGFE